MHIRPIAPKAIEMQFVFVWGGGFLAMYIDNLEEGDSSVIGFFPPCLSHYGMFIKLRMG